MQADTNATSPAPEVNLPSLHIDTQINDADNAPIEVPEQHELLATKNASQVPWASVGIDVKDAVLDKPYNHFSCPAELQVLPEGLTIPPELTHIIGESINLLLPPPPPEPENPVPEGRLTAANIQSNYSPEDVFASGALPVDASADAPAETPAENASSTASSPASANASTSDLQSTESNTTHPSRSSDSIPSSSKGKGRSWLTSPFHHAKATILAKEEARRQANDATYECVGCFDEFPSKKVVGLECAHHYCSECLSQLIMAAIRSENSFPPKCCLTEIHQKTIIKALSHDQREEYRSKAIEYKIPPDERWYCPSASCARFIPRSRVGPGAIRKCPYCSSRICSICRGPAHNTGEECPQDFGLEQTLEVAEQEGWRRCIKCKAMVELTVGCRHITCKCKAEFCYTCGAEWRTCSCTEVDENARRERVRAAKRERDQAAEREERELADAIAAVEEAERLEAERAAYEALERARREKREAEDRKAEAERREKLRIIEEQRRQIEAERRAKRLRQRVEYTINSRHSALFRILANVHKAQRAELENRHIQEAAELTSAWQESAKKFALDSHHLLDMLEKNISRRSEHLKTKHLSAVSSLTSAHESQEDETFLSLQIHLRGKPNREARTEATMSKLREAQATELAKLEVDQLEETKRFDERCLFEKEALKMGLAMRQDVEKSCEESAKKKYSEAVLKDREWTRQVILKRADMLWEWRTLAFQRGEVVEMIEDKIPAIMVEPINTDAAKDSQLKVDPLAGKTPTNLEVPRKSSKWTWDSSPSSSTNEDPGEGPSSASGSSPSTVDWRFAPAHKSVDQNPSEGFSASTPSSSGGNRRKSRYSTYGSNRPLTPPPKSILPTTTRKPVVTITTAF